MPGCVPRGVTLLECNLLRPPGLIDEQSAEEPGAGDDPGTRPALPPIAPKIASALALAASNRMWWWAAGDAAIAAAWVAAQTGWAGRRAQAPSPRLPEAQFCGVIVPNSPFISLSGPAVK